MFSVLEVLDSQPISRGFKLNCEVAMTLNETITVRLAVRQP